MVTSASIVPWKRIGTALDHPHSAEEAVRLSQLDYFVEKRPIKTTIGHRHVNVRRHYATVRMDTEQPLGIVKSVYSVVQNRDAFSFLSPLANREVFIEYGGTIDGGRKAFLLVRLPHVMRIGPSRDEIRPFLLAVNSHDGSSNIVVKPLAIRFACSNAIPAILRNSDPGISIRHTQLAHERIHQMRSLLARTGEMFTQLEYLLNRLASKHMTPKQISQFLKELVPENPDAESHARTDNMRRRILRLHENGIGSDVHRNTLFGLVNSVTEMVDHQSTGDANKHLKSVLFGGSGEKLVTRALQLAESMVN